jgi:uncharacterized NAD(P)/FAD-binding protein YdhS
MTMGIGIVGGGPSAVCLIEALAGTDLANGALTVFEPSPHLWRGRPFQPDVDSVRVNAHPDEMSVRAGDPGHFTRWLWGRAAAGEPVHPDPFIGTPFPSRALFGEYLAESARAALAVLRRRGWRVEVVRAAVTAATRTRDRIVLRTAHGRHHAVDHTVLCVGGGRPQDSYGLTGAAGFVCEPYPLRDTLRQLPADRHVAVVGSGLTAVDVVVGLAARGHSGPISMVSRSGMLPGVRQRPVEYTLQHFTLQRLRGWAATRDRIELVDLIALMRQEFAAAGPAAEAEVRTELDLLGVESPGHRLRRHLDEVDSPALGLRILQRAVPDTGPDVWPLLPERDRARILRDHHRTIMSLCCPMPPSSAAVLLELVDSGQLTLRSGLRTVRPRSAGGFDLGLEDSAHSADLVINAMSPPVHRIPSTAESLIASLETGGAAIRHPRGGLHLSRATSRIVAAGDADPRLYGLGDIAAGELFFTFGVPSLVDRAADITHAILAAVAGHGAQVLSGVSGT